MLATGYTGLARNKILDSFSILAPGGQTRTEYYRDTLHLTPSGYAVLNQALTQELESLQ